MILNIAIVDDLSFDRERLEKDIYDFYKENNTTPVNIQAFSDAASMLRESEKITFNIAFLDICMDNMNGIVLAKKLREKDPHMLIVFLTSSREYAFDAFPIHPFDYLVKPYEYETLLGVLNEAVRVLNFSEPEITIRIPHGECRIPVSAIISVHSERHSVYLHTTEDNCIRSIMTFSQINDMLSGYPCFLLCNRGVLINMDYVLSLEENSIRMKNGVVYPLRVRNRAELSAKFSQYQISKMKRRTRL